jgi:hypothetical protein
MTVDPAHVIQLAVAPVFLVSGVAALLGVMANRLARVIDRARSFETRWTTLDARGREAARLELAKLELSRHLCRWSINYCTAAALLVCLVIVTLFMEGFFATDLKWLAGALFVFAMLALIGGLIFFLRDVHLVTRWVSFDPARFE